MVIGWFYPCWATVNLQKHFTSIYGMFPFGFWGENTNLNNDFDPTRTWGDPPGHGAFKDGGSIKDGKIK